MRHMKQFGTSGCMQMSVASTNFSDEHKTVLHQEPVRLVQSL